MISCRQRGAARDITIPQLEAVGLDVHVMLDDCDETQRISNGAVGLRAIQHAIALGASGALIVEDDIDLASDFSRYLDLARVANRVTYLYLNDAVTQMMDAYGRPTTIAILNGEPITAGLREVQRGGNLMGSQCVYLPLATLTGLPLGDLAVSERPFDAWLSRTLKQLGITPLVALPHPVQHRQVRVARANQAKQTDKISRSYALERRWIA